MNVAAVDIGTNSVRLLATDARGVELERRMRITRLGQGVDLEGKLVDEAMDRTVAVLEVYGERIRDLEVSAVRVTATSAARDAANRDDFFERVARAVGARPELLSGEDEAALSFAGATAGLDLADGPFLVQDIGGGSTEFVLGHDGPEALISVDMGCVRLTERHLHSDPPTRAQLDAALQDASRLLEQVSARVPVQRARRLVGVAGTVTTLAAMAAGLDSYDPSRTHGAILERDEVERLFESLASATLVERRAMLHEPQRAEVIVGGCAVLVQTLRQLDIRSLQVSESDILDGLAASLRP